MFKTIISVVVDVMPYGRMPFCIFIYILLGLTHTTRMQRTKII